LHKSQFYTTSFKLGFDMRKPKQIHVEQTIQGTVATAGAIHPALGGIVGVAAALFGPALVRRIGRVEEILNEVRADPELFTADLLANEQFQDGMVLFIETYIRERNEEKLLIMRRVFKGFAKAPSLNEFPLEEMTDLVSRLRFGDISLFKLALTQAEQHKELRPPERERGFKLTEHPFNVSRLIYFGLLMEDRLQNGPQVRESTDPGFLYVFISPLGWQFAKYLTKDFNLPQIHTISKDPS